MQTRVAVVLFCFVAAAGAVARADRPEVPSARTSFALFPMAIGDWQGVAQPPLSDKVLAVLGADDYLTRAYFLPDRSGVGLYIGYWESQRTGDTIHSPLNCMPGAGWEPVSVRRVAVPGSSWNGRPEAVVNRVVIQKGLERQLVLYWYQAHNRIVASEYWGRFYMVADAVRMNRTDGAIVRVTVPIPEATAESEAAAERLGMGFINDLMPLLDGYLPL